MKFKNNRFRDILITLSVLLAAVLISLAFQHVFSVEEHITDLFIFAVFLVALWTNGYIFGIIAAFFGMLAVNFVFTVPFFAFSLAPENILSTIIMFVIAILTSTFTSQLKVQEMLKAENDKERMRANLLRAVSHDLRTPLTTIYGSSATLRNSGI